LTAKLETALYKRSVDQLGEKRVACENHMTTGPERMHGYFGPFRKEPEQLFAFLLVECRKSRKRLPIRAIE
jgi:hypothetical protein